MSYVLAGAGAGIGIGFRVAAGDAGKKGPSLQSDFPVIVVAFEWFESENADD